MTIPHVCDLRPFIDSHTHRLVEHAIGQLARTRRLPADHPAIRLHLTGSLIDQADALQTPTVIQAMEAGYTNTEIAILLGIG